MPRGYYGGGGGTADALFRLSDTLQRGIGGIGQKQSEDAALALAQRKTEYDIGRQQKADTRADEVFAMQKPGMELQAQQAGAKMEAFNQPLNIQGLFGPLSLHAMEAGADDEIASYLGATRDAKGNFLDANGKPLTQGYLQQSGKMRGVTDILLSRLDAGTAQQDMLDGLKEHLASGQLPPAEAEQAKRQVAFIEGMLKDPDKQGKLLGLQRQAAARLGDEKTLAAIDEKIAAHTKYLQESGMRREGYASAQGIAQGHNANALAVEEKRQAGAMERSKLKTESPGKGMEEGFWQTPQGEKLDPRSAYTRYLQAVPIQEDMDGVKSRDASFEDWAADSGYYFMPKGGRQPQLGPSGKAAGADSGGGPALVRRAASPQPPPQARQAADGNWYMPDPKRPGKYLRVD